MTAIATTKLSSKGQIVIPEEIRESLGFRTGDQFVVYAEKGVIILKTIPPPSLNEFDSLMARAGKQVRKARLKKSDIQKAIKKARR